METAVTIEEGVSSANPGSIVYTFSSLDELGAGSHEFVFQAVDELGHSSSLVKVYVVYDTTPPQLDTINSPLYTYVSSNLVDPSDFPSTPTLVFTDDNLYFKVLQITFDDTDYTSSVTVSGNGTGTLTIDFTNLQTELTTNGWHTPST